MSENIQNNKQPYVTVEFFMPEDMGPRDWGRELTVSHVPGLYTGKMLIINKGTKTEREKHSSKHQCRYLHSGELLVRFDSGDNIFQEKKMAAGDSIHVPPAVTHEEEAITDCVIFETSADETNANAIKTTINFFKPEDVGPRIWGREILISHVPRLFTGKLLLRKSDGGKKRSLQYHRVKNESDYMYSGEMWLYYIDEEGKVQRKKVSAGECVHIPPGAVHSEEAITDCVIFETSNPVFNDRVRVNDQYGWPDPIGSLPSTSIDEIEIR